MKIDINRFPQELHSLLKTAKLYDSSCHSRAKVYYIDSGYYLKIDDKGTLKREAELTQFFFEKGLGVELISYISTDKDYMVTRSAVGKDATHYLDEPKLLCEVLANALKMLHSQSVSEGTISLRHQQYVNSAMEHGCEIPWKADTFIHGDFCLPNIILNHGAFSVFIDVGDAGLGDKHIDLYWALWSLNYNLKTDAYSGYFLDLYGRENFDYGTLRKIMEMDYEN